MSRERRKYACTAIAIFLGVFICLVCCKAGKLGLLETLVFAVAFAAVQCFVYIGYVWFFKEEQNKATMKKLSKRTLKVQRLLLIALLIGLLIVGSAILLKNLNWATMCLAICPCISVCIARKQVGKKQ